MKTFPLFAVVLALFGTLALAPKASASLPVVSITAQSSTISAGQSDVLTVTASSSASCKVTGSDGSSYTLPYNGGTITVKPSATTTYTATSTNGSGTSTAKTTVTVGSGGGTSTPTVSISAQSSTISSGSSDTLTVTASNATSVVVTGSDGSSYSLASTGGTVIVKPTASTTYTASASNGSATATAKTTVTVASASGLPVVSITASSSTITAGQSDTLTVTASSSASVKVTGSDGSSYTLAYNGGSITVKPTATTTYTATSTNGSGSSTAQTTITVGAGTSTPTVTISAQSSTIASGGTDTLTVTASNATSVVVTGSDGSSYTLASTGGTVTVKPTATTTYTATASNGSTTAKAQTTVTVSSSTTPTVTIAAQSSTISSGSSDTLTVTASNATSVVVTGSDGSSYTLASTGGTVTVKPTATTTYTATASNGSTTATAKTTVTVSSSGLPVVSITASASTISAGQSDTLTVTASSSASVKVTGSDGSSYTLAYNGGTITVKPTATTTYTATSTNGKGSSTAQTTVTVGAGSTTPTVSISAANSTISSGSSDTLTVTASNATSVVVTGSDGSSYTLSATGGTVSVTPTSTTTYTAEASNSSTTVSAETTVTVSSTSTGDETAIKHVVFMLQENHSFDNYFGMLNPYRHNNGWDVGDDGKTYDVDGIDDKLNTITNLDDEGTAYNLYKLRTTCIDDDSSAWLESYGDVNRWDASTTRAIKMDGFVHIAEGFTKSCNSSGKCSGTFTDTTGERAMGYYDQDFLNWYYYMASQFALSDRWFSPMSSKSIPNRLATFAGGTTQGLVFDPGSNDHLPQLSINTIFQELQSAGVSWKIYYTVTQGGCTAGTACGTSSGNLPDTSFLTFTYSHNFVYANPTHAACTGTTQPSSVWGDTSNFYCVDPHHIAPLSQYYTDVKNNTLPAFAFIESGSGRNDEHPGSGQSVLTGQSQVANIVDALMTSPSWSSSAFFFSYDEGGGPYDHVPPVPGHSNDFTDSTLGAIPDIKSIAVNPDGYLPCVPTGGTPTIHCDLGASDPGAHSTDAAAQQGYAAQLGFRVPNMVISPFTRKHYVSHVPMDHTAIIKFVENRFLGSSVHLTNRDAAQPNLLDFFDFTNKPWLTPPSPPAPVTPSSLGYDPCNASLMGP